MNSPAPLMSAGLLLARNGIYGLAWVDAKLFVTGRFGALTDRLEIGEALFDGLPILADYEDDMRALPADGRSSFELPGVLIVTSDGSPSPRIDIHVFRDSGDDFLILVTRATGQASTDLAVARLQRDRRILLEQIEQQKLDLERTNAELALCNRDLEDFAAIITHDLKAPMRGLRYVADEIDTAIEAADPETARKACRELKEQSRRMATMMSQLLDYASLGRQRDAMETVDTGELIGSIVGSLPRPPGFRVAITGAWPRIDTYIAPLDLVLRNLIDNAIKHHDRQDAGSIAVDCRTDAKSLVITVADDGPGIPKGRQQAVFFPFRSYPGPGGETSSGTVESQGMGLAFVKRTVEAVGGSLSLASNPAMSRGSTFTIEWPLEHGPD